MSSTAAAISAGRAGRRPSAPATTSLTCRRCSPRTRQGRATCRVRPRDRENLRQERLQLLVLQRARETLAGARRNGREEAVGVLLATPRAELCRDRAGLVEANSRAALARDRRGHAVLEPEHQHRPQAREILEEFAGAVALLARIVPLH